MTDILFGNNNRPVLKLLAKRSLKAQKNTIAVLAIMLAISYGYSYWTIVGMADWSVVATCDCKYAN